MIFVRESGSTSRDITDRLLNEHGLRSQIALEAASHQTIAASVSETSGIGMLPRSCLGIHGREESLVVLDIPELVAPISLQVVYLTDRRKSPALARLLELVCQEGLWDVATTLHGQTDAKPRKEEAATGSLSGAAHR